jgi:DNA-binding transcriptional LysR family regulator
MELRQIYYVLEIAKHKNFTKAAEALFTTQPNLSKQVNSLEQELGTKLFFRSQHSVVLTRDGERFCAHAKKIVDELDSLMSDFNQNTESEKTVLNIAVFPFFQKVGYAYVLRNFYREHANVLGTLRLSDNFQAYSAMDSGDIDFSILKLRPEDKQDRFTYLLLMEEELMGMVSSASSLAANEKLSAEDLRDTLVLTGEEGSHLYEEMANIYRERDIPYNVAYKNTFNIDFLIDMLSDIDGITFITESAAASAADEVAVIPLDPPVNYHTYLVYPKNREYTGIYKSFIDYVVDELEAYRKHAFDS